MDEPIYGIDEQQIDIPKFHHSVGFKNLFAALIQSQSEFKPVPKNKTASIYSPKTGKTYSYKYADLADILAMALPVLTKHDLGIIQPNVLVNSQLRIVTHLIHSTGEWMCGDGFALIETGPRQDVGTDATYNRRYDLCSLLGIVADEDIDAQKDMLTEPPTVRQPSPSRTNQAKQKPQTEPDSYHSAAEELLNHRDEIIAKLKLLEPSAHNLGQMAKKMFPGHENTKTLTVPDLEHLLKTLKKEKAPAAAFEPPVLLTQEIPLEIPPDVEDMFDEGVVTTASRLQGPTIGKGLAQRLHKLIGIHKIHTEEELKRDYLDPVGLEHVSDLPRDLYDSLCAWAEGTLEEGSAVNEEQKP
jgi:hypothetical protein